MAPTLLPNVEAIVSQFLRQRSEVTALVGDRVVTHLSPNDQTYPVVRVRRIAGAPVYSVPFFFDEAWFQVDVWGGSAVQAWTAAATVQAALTELPQYVTALGQVTGVKFGSMADIPDDAQAPPRPRYRFDVVVWARTKP